MIKTIVIIFFALIVIASATSICDTYTGPGKTNDEFMTSFVTAVVGLVTAADTVTQPYFNGSIGTDMNGDTHDFVSNSTAAEILIGELVSFFGTNLQCSDGTVPTFNGPNMAAVHQNNDINKAAFEYFDQQVVYVAQVSGVSHDDQVTIATFLESFRGDICTESDCFTSPYSITIGNGGDFFNPPGGYNLTVGSSVVFVWYSTSVPHAVVQGETGTGQQCTALSGGFSHSAVTAPTSNFTVTLNDVGVVDYFCSVATHCSAEDMYGTLTVYDSNAISTASASSSATTSSFHDSISGSSAIASSNDSISGSSASATASATASSASVAATATASSASVAAATSASASTYHSSASSIVSSLASLVSIVALFLF